MERIIDLVVDEVLVVRASFARFGVTRQKIASLYVVEQFLHNISTRLVSR